MSTRSSDHLPASMMAMVTVGQGGYDQLVYREVPVPTLQAGEVLLQVLAAGINNTDINTRVGWYGAGWNSATPFPLIQGADCCGRVVAMAPDVISQVPGQRVLVRSCMRTAGFGSMDTRWLGTDFDGAFAQYVKVPATEVFAVHSDWTDAELASLPCAWGTAENMLERAHLGVDEQVWVTGASGGVGSAAVQLAKRRGAVVTAITSRDKREQVAALGADNVLCREDGAAAFAQLQAPDLVVDNVVGSGFAALLKALRRGGRYVTSGAIAGADVALDMRSLYLRDITLIGSTAWDEAVFPNLVGYVERNEIRPVVAATFALQDMALAQQAFLEKRHTGNLVLIP
ncbi:zinc-binding dehydrogenase [Rhodoferax sp. GW822-FHT02A01]|uniref:zinc-binding dehydrogenase n=1 Tax=Rhodoferax sp. GW822-FHT02A01 TaxID=3141537 RepID=UPI00315CE2CC